MRFHEPTCHFLILFTILGSITHTVLAEEKASAVRNLLPERFTRDAVSKSKFVVASNPTTAVASNDLDALPRDKRQLGSIRDQICSKMCPVQRRFTRRPCPNFCRPSFSVGPSAYGRRRYGGRTLLNWITNLWSSLLASLLHRPSQNPVDMGGMGDMVDMGGGMGDMVDMDDSICPCPKIYRPVCGTDGKTYPNDCEAGCKGAMIAMSGACSEMESNEVVCACTKIYEPVCGTDGETYPNDCEAKCKGAMIAMSGACSEIDSDEEFCTCTKIYRPVCGTDGKTYPNECEAKCQGTMVAQMGACFSIESVDCRCHLIYAPVCGTDGKTYSNKCEAECTGVGAAFPGPCLLKPRSRLGCVCPLLHWPVCGVDGVMYPNTCELKCAGVGLAWAVFEESDGMQRRCYPIID